MKKFIVLLTALALTLLLISCGDSSANSGTTGSSEDVLGTQSSQNDVVADIPSSSSREDKVDDPNDEIPEDEKKLLATFEGEKTEYYPTLLCGEYFGDEFNGAQELNCYYSIIKTYKELCAKTERGCDYKEEIFEDNYVLAIYRSYRFKENVIGNFLGYKNFRLSRGMVTIDRCYWDADFLDTVSGEWVDLHYVLIPREAVDKYSEIEQSTGEEYSLPTWGKLSISSNATHTYDTAYCSVQDNRGYENGQSWLIEPAELKQFLSDNRLSVTWNRTCDCQCDYYHCSTAYKILIVYHEDMGTGISFSDKPFGYKNASVEGNTLYITREYETYSPRTKNIQGFEFVAIPNYAFAEQLENINAISVTSIEHVSSSPERSDIDLSNMANVEEKTYNYYEFLDLGIYYYYDKLPVGDAYHVITSYEELKQYVANPFISAEEMSSNYVVAVKIDGYDYERLERIVYGIRDLHFDEIGVLCATADIGYCRDDEELEIINQYPDNVLYILVPREELDIEGQALTGNIKLTKVSDEDAHSHSFTGISTPYAALNQVWAAKTYAERDALESLLNIDLNPYITTLGNGELYLVFYGKLRTNPRFYNFRIDGNKMYLDIVQDAGKEEPKGYYYVIKLDNFIGYNEAQKYKMNITKYTREPASIRRGEYLTESLYSYVLSNDAEVGLLKTPDFEWKLIDNYDILAELFAEYGGIYPTAQLKDIDFETAYILAHYAVEGCTGCHRAASFENVRCGNGCLYVDKYYDSHKGGEAESPCLYFVVIPKEKVTGEVTNAVVLQKNMYSVSDENSRVNSEYVAHVMRDFKELPDFDYAIIESKEALEEIYAKYTENNGLDALLNLDFEKMCIVAYVRMYDSSLVLGGFRNMRVENNKIFIDKYIEAKGMISGNDGMYTVLHLIAVEKIFTPEEINEVVDTCEIDWL